jgi:hypothetical protein
MASLIEQAEQLRNDGKLQEAEFVPTRAVQIDRDDVLPWRKLAAVQRDRAAALIRSGELLSAAQASDRAGVSVNSITALLVEATGSSLRQPWCRRRVSRPGQATSTATAERT